MNNSTLLFRNAIVLLCLLISSSTFSQTTFHTADFETSTDGWTLGGADAIRLSNATYAYSGNWSINLQDNNGNVSAMDSPLFALSVYDKVDFKFFFVGRDFEAGEDFFIEYRDNPAAAWVIAATFVANNITSPNQGDFLRDDYSSAYYTKTVTLLKTNYTFPILPTAQFRVRSDASDSSDDIYIDLITITGTTFATPTTGPGGITSNLDLWLRGDKLDGSTVGTDGSNVSKWTDNGKGNHAETVVAGTEPVYRNNIIDNFNFNPVIEFENDYNTAGRDLKYINTRDELSSTDGFNSNDIFIVLVPDYAITTTMYPMDTFTGHDPTEATYSEDVTGFGFGDFSQRFTGEYFSYAQGTSTGPNVGYGRSDTSGTNDYTKIGIFNTRHDIANSAVELFLNANIICDTTSDLPDFTAVNDSRYWIGRSQHFNGSFGGRIAEIITYDSRKTDGATERRRIESYLALKYGITLGVNGTSIDYVDSAGNTVWDINTGVPADDAFNHDIAGIFRDDSSNHEQKQSKSVNTSSVVTIGHKDIASTNSANTNSFNTNRDYLVWGHNNAALTGTNTISVNLGTPSTTVTTLFDRRWKIAESRPTGSNDIQDVKVSIPSSVLPAKVANEEYAMIVSSTSAFGTSDIVDIIPMTLNGSNYETWYDFDNTRYFTFGIASRVSGKYKIDFAAGDFLVGEDSVDLNPTYTVSAWLLNNGNGGSYVSKGNSDRFLLRNTGKVRLIANGSILFTSSAAITDNKWHHVAASYDGTDLSVYIDGVEDAASPVTVALPTPTTDKFAIGALYTNKSLIQEIFDGDIDEVRIWDRALTQAQIQYIMNQEIVEHTDNTVDGDVLPQTLPSNIVNSIPWNDIQAYHNINEFYGTTVVDGSNNNNWLRIKYLVTDKTVIGDQTAPLPYVSANDGSWDDPTTWVNGSELYTPGSQSLVGTNTVNCNIVTTNNNITMSNATLPVARNNNRTLLGLIDNNSNELIVSTDDGLTVTHYLEVNGAIDLEGEAQLVQTDKSALVVGANGDLERDQQGTADTFTYNYWSSPVGAVNITADYDTYKSRYTVPDVIREGTTPSSPGAISFISSGYDGTSSPFGIADYWIWKFANLEDGNYSLWQHMRSTGNILPGEGFTMKGPGTGSISTDQNYVFNGKPNNGDITLSIGANNDYLVGNPYPSAIDADVFIADNPDTSGTLYFWEHWGNGTHNLSEYQGGYALYNLSGGAQAATIHPDVGTGGSAAKVPGQYVPVSQGFFVYSAGGGFINFKNKQRVFEKDDAVVDNSTFIRSSSNETTTPSAYNDDGRMKLRIGFDSFNNLHRQLLVTVDQNATENIDWSYDGKLNENQMDDMYWMIENDKYIIQGIDTLIPESILPLGINVRDDGYNTITIDHLENVPANFEIYVHDNVLDIYHDLRQGDYEVNLTAGNYLDRFAIVFSNPNTTALSNGEFETNSAFEAFYSGEEEHFIIRNPNLINIESMELFNILGQSMYFSNELETQNNTKIKVSNLSVGTYIINLNTESGKISKKVLVE